jgi:hypothetical protein
MSCIMAAFLAALNLFRANPLGPDFPHPGVRFLILVVRFRTPLEVPEGSAWGWSAPQRTPTTRIAASP